MCVNVERHPVVRVVIAVLVRLHSLLLGTVARGRHPASQYLFLTLCAVNGARVPLRMLDTPNISDHLGLYHLGLQHFELQHLEL